MVNKYLIGVFLILLALSTVYYLGNSMMPSKNEVVVYVSADQDYSEPVLKDFEKQTGIKVKAVYDTEASKTVGLVNRLIAEKDRPQADVFWNNELIRTILLKEKGVLAPYNSPGAAGKPVEYKDPEGYWTGFSARTRVIIYNTGYISPADAPESLSDLKNPKWNGKVGIANPALGTTGDQVAALFSLWGDDAAKGYFNQLKDNGVKVVDSNGMVKSQVAAGDLWLGLADTDDAYGAIQSGKPVAMVFPDQKEGEIGTLMLPHSVMLIKGAPHEGNGKKLIDYLLSDQVEQMYANSGIKTIPLGNGVQRPDNVPSLDSIKTMNVTQYEVYSSLNRSQDFITRLLIN